MGTLLCFTTQLSSAQADIETAKINSVSYRGIRFGQDVGISNGVAIIGASEEYDQVASAGAAYIYRRDTNGWQLEDRLALDNKRSFDRFGWSVDIDGARAIVGSNGSGIAVAVIYQYDGAAWIETTTLFSTSEGINAFGRSVALSGDVAIVGAPYSTANNVNVGGAFIYRYNGSTWIEEAALSLDSPRTNTQFGFNVAIEGDVAIVGAPGRSFDDSTGSAHVYRYNGISWIKEAELLADEDITEDQFGRSVAVSDGVIIIGAPLDDPSGEDAGSAYVFRFDGDAWSQEAKLTPSDGGSFDYFGMDVDVSNNVTVIGAPGDDDNGRNSGSAYEFRYDGSSWVQTSKLSASDASEIADLGASVSISEDIALLGASGDNENGVISGAAYTFDIAQDTDGDGISDTDDNCPLDWNPIQENFDGDLLGDACDLDDDNDGLDDDQDPSPYNASISAAPTPVSPVGDNIPLGVDFEWDAMPDATRYAIEVQHNGLVRAYEGMILAAVACNSGRCRYSKTDAALEGNNRWRLRAGTASGDTDWSPWAEFVVNGSANPVLNPDDQYTPATDIPGLPNTGTPSGSGVMPGTDFRWPVVPRATHYAIEIQHNGEIRGYASMLDAQQLCASGTCVYIKSDAAQPGSNRWRLKAINAIGATNWTPWTDFTVTQSTPSNSFIPAVPVPGAPAGSLSISAPEFNWAAVNGATRYALEVQHNGIIHAYDETINAATACAAGTCQYIKADATKSGGNRWRLRASGSNAFSQWSDWQNFTTPQ